MILLKTRTEAALEASLERYWDSRTQDLPGKMGIHEAVRFLLLPPVILGLNNEAKLLADLVEALGMVSRISVDGRLAYEVAKLRGTDLLDGISMVEAGTSSHWGWWKTGPVGDLAVHYWKRQLAAL